jgi:DNA-binding transcriptional LysR family regulator
MRQVMTDVEPRRPTRNPAFELRHLKYFVALVDERNFERAAARLGIAQPGLSQQIMSLEGIVGTSLLDRTRRSVKLTQAGQVLYDEATKILAQAETAMIAVNRASRGETGRVSIGYVASAAYSGAVVQSIKTYRVEHPSVEIDLVEMELRKQLARIFEGLLDFGFIRGPAPIPDGLATHIIRREPVIVMIPDGHPLKLERGGADLAALSHEVFLTPQQPRDVGFHGTTHAACAEAGFEPMINSAALDVTGIASMVAIGAGVSILPKSLESVRLPGIRYVALPRLRTTSDIIVAYRKTESSPAVRAFIGHSRRAA